MPDSPNLGPNPEPGTVAVRTSTVGAKPHSTDKAALLLLAKKRFRASADREAKMRAQMLEDQRFRASEQWPASVKAERELDGRPCITINRLPVFIRQVTNQQRQSKPAITINPVDSGSDPKTAEVFQGLIRHIEIRSQADVAYDTACDHQVTIGRGFFRVITEWSDINPWEQDIVLKRIRNPFTVYFDPACQEADYHDARYAFIVEDVPKDEFVARYGEEKARSADLFESIGDRTSDWMPEGKVRVAEYYYVEETREEIALLSDRTEKPATVVKDPAFAQLLEEQGITVVRTRTITHRQVKWAKITGAVVLEQRDWPGRWIPIVPVLGDEIDINGEVDLRGMVRDARDPQRMYNYWVSAETETIALAPRSPFVGAAGQFETFEHKWKLANRRNFPYLEYNAIDIQGTPVAPPQRNAIEPPIAAIVAATKQSDNDLKAVTGIYDASLGERGPQEAARAIVARQKQSDIANINWIDNLARAMRALGRIFLDLIPKVYDTPRVMRILGVDDKPQLVLVHAGNADAITDELRDGIAGIYDLSVGRYDVTVTVGPSYQSRRQEAIEAMTAFMQAFPPAAPAIGDLLAENMDWPGATVIAKRLKKMVPPQLQDEQDGDPEQKAMLLQQKLSQQGQMMEQMAQHLNALSEEKKGKQQELASRERIAAMQMHTQILIAQIGATKDATLQEDGQNHEALLAALEGEQRSAQASQDLEHQTTLAGLEQQHQARLATIKLQHDAAMKLHDASIKGKLESQKAALKIAADEAQHRRQLLTDQQQGMFDRGHDLGLAVADAGQQAREAALTRQHDLLQLDQANQHEAAMTVHHTQHEQQMTADQRRADQQQAQAQQQHDVRLAKLKPAPAQKPKK